MKLAPLPRKFSSNPPYEPEPGKPNPCVLMFSGGRDSTLAAVRLYRQGYRPTLVTISSGHLVNIRAVRERLCELRSVLPDKTRWMRIRQPEALRTDTSFYERTCLPCHHAYVVAGAVLALKLKTQRLAFGYATYQGSWPEQTQEATRRLGEALARHAIELLLPVYGIASREQAVEELQANGLDPRALEQKCLQQVTNVELPPDLLTKQIQQWEAAIDASVSEIDRVDLEVLESKKLSEA